MHDQNVMHRDIKSSNILINKEGVVKIADFGLAAFINPPERRSSQVVTLGYRAPELLLGHQDYNESIDIWAVGCCFAEMLCGKAIFKGVKEEE